MFSLFFPPLFFRVIAPFCQGSVRQRPTDLCFDDGDATRTDDDDNKPKGRGQAALGAPDRNNADKNSNKKRGLDRTMTNRNQ